MACPHHGGKSRVGKVVSCNDCGGIVSVDGNPPGSERAEEHYHAQGRQMVEGKGSGSFCSVMVPVMASAASIISLVLADVNGQMAFGVPLVVLYAAAAVVHNRVMARQRRPREAA